MLQNVIFLSVHVCKVWSADLNQPIACSVPRGLDSHRWAVSWLPWSSAAGRLSDSLLWGVSWHSIHVINSQKIKITENLGKPQKVWSWPSGGGHHTWVWAHRSADFCCFHYRGRSASHEHLKWLTRNVSTCLFGGLMCFNWRHADQQPALFLLLLFMYWLIWSLSVLIDHCCLIWENSLD